tara:strand:- start:1047 stop:1181 length:135 start_codon:yes stop_codon:yes gene_type:complete
MVKESKRRLALIEQYRQWGIFGFPNEKEKQKILANIFRLYGKKK